MFRKASDLLKGDGVRYAKSILVKHFAGILQLVELSLGNPTDSQAIGFSSEKKRTQVLWYLTGRIERCCLVKWLE